MGRCAGDWAGECVEVPGADGFTVGADRWVAALEYGAEGPPVRGLSPRGRGDHLPVPDWDPVAGPAARGVPALADRLETPPRLLERRNLGPGASGTARAGGP